MCNLKWEKEIKEVCLTGRGSFVVNLERVNFWPNWKKQAFHAKSERAYVVHVI